MASEKIEQTADKIEQCIYEVFPYAESMNVAITNYSLLYDSNKDNSWYVVLWVAEKHQQSQLIEDGRFYYIHQFLHSKIIGIEHGISVGIRLKAGTGPQTNEEYGALLDECLKRYDVDEKAKNKICHYCGHSWDKHQLRGFPVEPAKVPHEGWMVCPEPDCNCFLTWDVPIK